MEYLKSIILNLSEVIKIALELISVICVFMGMCRVLVIAIVNFHQTSLLHIIRVRFGSWLALALEFQLAADILATTINPSMDELIKLAIIALIRTFLNYFLSKDIESIRQ